MNLYLIYKTLHILFMVSWFAGIFYLPRLFVYHVESESQDVQNQLSVMEKKLFKFITPLGILALIFGVLMGLLSSDFSVFFSQNWIVVKLLVVASLIGYQALCWKILKELALGDHHWTGFKLRLFNEAPVILLLIGIIAAVFKF
ncbi:CopD family protein [Gammaproteobacteria bacterium]|nr:CopD family protein [bacterium]MDA8924737.1 CopD family protein [Gammaproteobacteria bacterium]MDA9048779.1 CopD family protein [Gammaproteobacteria bacterium]MDA9154273.1 CopD family protein [Gammaproteobacteria bacterium]MDA9341235.1 CopD family protein [Gammaproteobacteria bacterium]